MTALHKKAHMLKFTKKLPVIVVFKPYQAPAWAQAFRNLQELYETIANGYWFRNWRQKSKQDGSPLEFPQLAILYSPQATFDYWQEQQPGAAAAMSIAQELDWLQPLKLASWYEDTIDDTKYTYYGLLGRHWYSTDGYRWTTEEGDPVEDNSFQKTIVRFRRGPRAGQIALLAYESPAAKAEAKFDNSPA